MHVKDDCWCIDALYKLKPNKVHSKEVRYVKVHHEEVHHTAIRRCIIRRCKSSCSNINDADC